MTWCDISLQQQQQQQLEEEDEEEEEEEEEEEDELTRKRMRLSASQYSAKSVVTQATVSISAPVPSMVSQLDTALEAVYQAADSDTAILVLTQHSLEELRLLIAKKIRYCRIGHDTLNADSTHLLCIISIMPLMLIAAAGRYKWSQVFHRQKNSISMSVDDNGKKLAGEWNGNEDEAKLLDAAQRAAKGCVFMRYKE